MGGRERVNERHSPRPGTKQALLADLLRRKAGASIRDLVDATGWRANTVHAALATLRKLGCQIAVERTADGNRYRMEGGSSGRRARG